MKMTRKRKKKKTRCKANRCIQVVDGEWWI